MSPYAPRVESIKINPDKIREVIGKGGETIQKITAETGAEIDIKDDGTVMIASPDGESIDAAKQWINDIVAEPEVGAIYVTNQSSVSWTSVPSCRSCPAKTAWCTFLNCQRRPRRKDQRCRQRRRQSHR